VTELTRLDLIELRVPWLCAPISTPAPAASQIWFQDSIWPGWCPDLCPPASAIQPVVTKTVAVNP